MIPAGEPVLRPFVLLAYATPKIALAPLMIIWFGIGILPKVILAATFVFFVVFLEHACGHRDGAAAAGLRGARDGRRAPGGVPEGRGAERAALHPDRRSASPSRPRSSAP
jgi:hypothetical protein